MNVLICYATTEGQTLKIARFCADQLIARGHCVELLPADAAGETGLSRFDAAILAGSVHVGKLQAGLAQFARDHAEALNTMPTLMVQVSLAAAGDDPDEQNDLARIAAQFCEAAGWTPGKTLQVAGAFRFAQYDFFKSWAMRWIAHQKGQEVDPQADTEYTDWAALAHEITQWANAATPD
jgi:menaquinone-dependent protoporphyrinogen oxidase